MAKKMYYSEEEVAAKLKTDAMGIGDLVAQGKLKAFQDGARKMYKVDEVDALAGPAEIQLTASDEAPTLADVDKPRPAGKEDTVITAEGISIFDDEDLEIETADPMAKTQIAPSVEDQITIEGVGSGSGLLDLTRERDDTSLGAEVLDHIDMEGGGVGSGMESAAAPPPAYAPPEQVLVEATFEEEIDAATGAFNGLVVGVGVCILAVTAVILAAMRQFTMPPYLREIQDNKPALVGGFAFVLIIAAVVGYFVGKKQMARRAAMNK